MWNVGLDVVVVMSRVWLLFLQMIPPSPTSSARRRRPSTRAWTPSGSTRAPAAATSSRTQMGKLSASINRKTRSRTDVWTPSGPNGCTVSAVPAALVGPASSPTRATCPRPGPASWTRSSASTWCPIRKSSSWPRRPSTISGSTGKSPKPRRLSMNISPRWAGSSTDSACHPRSAPCNAS